MYENVWKSNMFEIFSRICMKVRRIYYDDDDDDGDGDGDDDDDTKKTLRQRSLISANCVVHRIIGPWVSRQH